MGIGVLLSTCKIPNNNAPSVILLYNDVTEIGRQSEVKIDTSRGKEVSKKHSTVYRVEGRDTEMWIIEDNKSLNGTFVNGRKIKRIVIKPGDEIVFGGGSNFTTGDVVISTDTAECRYRFYTTAPRVRFSSTVDLGSTLSTETPHETCVICLCDLIAAETLPCGHTFCLGCIHEWARTCCAGLRPCVCPLCRTSFQQSELTPEEGIMTPEELEVFTIEPFLNSVNMKNCKAVKSLNIFKPWTESQREAFWRAYDAVKSNTIRRTIFLHLTKATVGYITNQSNTNLAHALVNFNRPISQCRSNLTKDVIFQILKLNYQPRSHRIVDQKK